MTYFITHLMTHFMTHIMTHIKRVLLNEAMAIWLNVTNHHQVHNTTNSILDKHNAHGLAVFTLLTNTKVKLLAQ